MIKRATKRRNRKILGLVLTVVGSILFLSAAYFSINRFVPVFTQRGMGNSDKILQPVGTSTTVDDLKKQLSDKNILFDSMIDSSMSGTIVGKIIDGPTVYFSHDRQAASQVVSLELIIQRLKIDNKMPTLIDLTATRPIVKF